ncbi:helix-turn-helix domain-containing protein [Streptococcus mitis]|uniref:helix-turn-helix domain-containing protein n=1 Tax=Streptococcus mitis TaxID=28037 RepID=UPI00098B86CF
MRAGRRGELRVLPQKYFKEGIGADSPFLNKKQTCNYLSVSNNTLDIWIAMGLPYIRIGKSIRFSKESINQWMTRFEIST